MRRAGKIDSNQRAIVDCLRSEGATVHSLSGVGHGMPDLIIGVAFRTYLAEVKNGEKVPSAQRLTPDQERFHASWLGHPVVILRDVKQTRAWVRRMLGTTL